MRYLLCSLLLACTVCQADPVPVTYYYADYCGWCRKQTPVLATLVEDGKILLTKVDCEKDSCKGVKGLPTMKVGDKKLVGFHTKKEILQKL